MANANDKPESTKYLKNIFEQSLVVLCEDKSSAAETHLQHASLPVYMDPVNLQKRALLEAAKALAALWNISDLTDRAKYNRV
jgi:hypothetical protein